jgi:ABC-type glycerol-3-phosphate transport system substrate-binding protein
MEIYGLSVSIPKHTSERNLAAWLFLKFFTSPNMQETWVRATNYFPVRKSVLGNLEDYFYDNPQYENASTFLPYGKSGPSVQNYDTVGDLIHQAFSEIMHGADVILTLNQLNNDANATLH